MNGFLQLCFFIGYNACVCYAFFLMLAVISFRVSLVFVRRIYDAVKSEWIDLIVSPFLSSYWGREVVIGSDDRSFFMDVKRFIERKKWKTKFCKLGNSHFWTCRRWKICTVEEPKILHCSLFGTIIHSSDFGFSFEWWYFLPFPRGDWYELSIELCLSKAL